MCIYVTEFTDILIGLLRLRKCSPETFRPELVGGVSIVRELHVYPITVNKKAVLPRGNNPFIVSLDNETCLSNL